MVTWRFTQFQPPTASVVHRLPMAALTCAAALLLGVALAWAQSLAPTARNSTSLETAENNKSTHPQGDQHLREGTEIVDQLGYFRLMGDRVAFLTDDAKTRLVVLENLNLERIVRVVADNPGRLQWEVTGTITEYRAANFLFVRRAALKSRVHPWQDGQEGL